MLPTQLSKDPAHRSPGIGAAGAALSRSARAAFLALIALPLAAHSAAAQRTPTPQPNDPARPQLVVLVTVDQLLPEYLDRFGPEFTGGLGRLLKNGAVFTNAVHDHATTETAPGHATLGSGRHPSGTGIVRNNAGIQDPQSPLLEGGRGGGASPWRFRGSSLFDWMRVDDQWSRALSVSRKDRGAILPLGRAQQSVFWYSNDGRFVTSRYYADTLPAWVQAFNKQDFVAQLDGASWTLLNPASTYAEPDSVLRENDGIDIVFPHVLPPVAARRASQLTEYPVMDSLTVSLALKGVKALDLGGGNATDFLAVSLSTTDAIGHRYGPASREVHDQVLRVDRYLGILFDSLYTMFDSSRVLIALSADHGVAPYPELYFTGTDSMRGRVDVRPTFARARSGLLAAGIEGDAVDFESGMVVMDRARISRRGMSVDSLIDAMRAEFRAMPGVMRVDARADLPALAARGDKYARRWQNAMPHDFGAELAITLEPYYYWAGVGYATHGMPHDYDAHVPLIFHGAPFKAGRYDAPARTVDLAATLAAVLGITPSEPIDGVPLQEAMRGDINSGSAGRARPATAATDAGGAATARRR